MVRVKPSVLGTALFSALGLAPLACGGAFSKGDGGGNGAAGSQTTGGSHATGGSKSMGGNTGLGGMSSANAFPCDDAMPAGPGYERCANGTLHRPTIEQCSSSLPRPALTEPWPAGDCKADADCNAMPYGYCDQGSGDGSAPTAYCNYGCVNDADCFPGMICVCGDPVGTCVLASCTSDADCGDGLRCQSYDQSMGCGSLGFACQTPADQCGSDTDCGDRPCWTPGIDANGVASPFTCQSYGCVVGRPFLVEGAARVAAVTPRNDWQRACELDLDFVPVAVREAAGRAWCRIGQMEHASVAAFARFALQLLSLGAPPALVEAATSAMADETRHAQLAFGVTSALLGEAVGPAVLDVEHSLLETSLVDVARLVVREGCIGETCAALEAREAALHATQPELAQLLHGIADDESRHAELAWRFVSYALEREPEKIAALLQAELLAEQALVQSEHLPAISADELAAAALGILPQRLRSELRALALREVVTPCALGLLRRAAGALAENQVLSARSAVPRSAF